jgi:hypothetical protein
VLVWCKHLVVVKPQFYALDKVSYGTRSDGAPVVLISVEPALAIESRLPIVTVKSVSTLAPLSGWQLLANLTLVVVDGPNVGFLLAAPAWERTPAANAWSFRWAENVDASSGAVALLVDGVHLGGDDDFDGVEGRGGFVRVVSEP